MKAILYKLKLPQNPRASISYFGTHPFTYWLSVKSFHVNYRVYKGKRFTTTPIGRRAMEKGLLFLS